MNPTDTVITSNPIISEFARVFYNQKIAVIEQSVKLLEKKILQDRIWIGVNSEDILPEDAMHILREMGLDDSRSTTLLREFPSIDMIGFSIELDGNETNCRVYVENYPTNRQIKTMKSKGVSEVKTITSYKWNVMNPESYVRTSYYTQLDNSKDAVVSAINQSEFGKVPRFIHDAYQDGKRFTVTNAWDQNSPRRSFDLKMSDIYLNDISNDAFEFVRDIDVKASLKHLSRVPLHHFGGGVDKTLSKFLNLYFSVYNVYNNT